MERRHFLGLLATPALASLLQACGGGSSGDSTIPDGGDGYEVIRSSLARAATTPDEAAAAVRALNLLGVDLHALVTRESDGNSVISPASILVALAMTRAGAAGTTADQMDEALHLRDEAGDGRAVHRALNALTAALESRNAEFAVDGETAKVELNVTNSLWGQQGMTWKEPFLDTLAAEYGAAMRVVDYVADTESARTAINGWVSESTRERIPELLERGVLTPDSRLTLVNAIYMKAQWLNPFPEDSTSDGDFTDLSGATTTVPMMRTSERTLYSAGDGWQAVHLPYVGGELAMLILVPDGGKFADVEGRLAEGLLDTATEALADAQVTLSMPRFDIDQKFELTEAMRSLGMVDAFDGGAADFSGMTDDARLFISFIIHQANITVDEKGTEAAAATAVGMSETSAPGLMVDLEVDRPFIFAVRDVPTGAVLFLGRVTTPA